VLLAPPPGLTTGVCAALGVSRASVHRRRIRLIAPPPVCRARSRPTRALTSVQQRVVLDLLHSPRFADQAPTEIYATLLDDGVYHCSIRTMYRLLGQHGEVRERRRQLRHPVYQKPELLAEKPNEVWSWDITKLMGPTKWSYFYLYVILDIFSRRVVGWRVADAESATLFRPLFTQPGRSRLTARLQRTPRGSLTRRPCPSPNLPPPGSTGLRRKPCLNADLSLDQGGDGLMLTRVPCGQPRRRMCSFAHADFAIDVRAAPRTRSTRSSGSAGSASPRQATCWSGRTSTSLWR
jgi:transposase InsO family protein